ncbi:MAG: marine proteobacterial sortase target protein [Motiliproteus sp.]
MTTVRWMLAILLCWTSSLAFSTERVSDDLKEQARLELRSDNGAGRQALLQHTDVHFDITGMLVRTRVIQTFHNQSTEWAEGIYTYPLPENSAVDHLRMKIGERIIEGQIKEREQARKTYEKAKQSGRRASLIEQQRPNIFTTSVANIGPGDSIVIEIEYQQQARYDNGQFKLRFPMVVAPRYIPGSPPNLPKLPLLTNHGDLPSDAPPDINSDQQNHNSPASSAAASSQTQYQPLGGNAFGWAAATDQVPDASLITPLVVSPGEKLRNRVSINAILKAGFTLQQVMSSYHSVDIQQPSSTEAHIRLTDTEVAANRDFELVWTPKSSELPQAALLSHRIANQQYGLLMVLPPTVEKPNQSLPKSMTLVLDISGSMHGDSIGQAKLSLQQAIDRLQTDDLFNVIVFNNRTSSLYPQPVLATNNNRQRARAFVASLDANGGTEMASAISQALSQPPQQGYVEQILFITDGAVGNEDALFRLIQSQLGKQRLYTVGIGSAPNSHFMSKAAQMGKGTFTYIGDTREVQQKMDILLTKLSSPQLTDIQINSIEPLQMYPEKIPDLYRGEPLLLSFRAENMPKHLDITGYLGERRWQQRFKLQTSMENPAVSVLWGRSKIASLTDDYRLKKDPQLRQEIQQNIVDTALFHHLVSKFTSLVAVDVTPVRPASESLKTRAEKTELPKGWSHRKVFGTANTATPAAQLIINGLIMLVLALLLLWFGRRSKKTQLATHSF